MALARARRESRLQSDYQRLVAKSPGHGELIGESRPMCELKSKITRLARATGCVLVRGESGSGKELVARALHRVSSRADRPMLSVNCAAIPADLMESQLFGHKAGSFTGADRDHAGYFQQADLGTLFLDEVGEMTLEGQAKLLRILEGHPFLPVGAVHEVSVDVRVIAATNQDLQTYVRERKFREDLYYRLSVFELVVPPLRDRGEDIGLLIDFFLEHFRRQHGRPGLELSVAARDKLLGYQWPGNVRAIAQCDRQRRRVGRRAADRGRRSGTAGCRVRGELESLNLEYWERRLIGEALHRTDGNVPDAARLLGIARATLYRKIEQYGDHAVTRPRVRRFAGVSPHRTRSNRRIQLSCSTPSPKVAAPQFPRPPVSLFALVRLRYTTFFLPLCASATLWFVLLACSCPTASAQEWTRFRGPNGSGESETDSIPAVWSDADDNWKVSLPGVGHASPVLWGDRIF